MIIFERYVGQRFVHTVLYDNEDGASRPEEAAAQNLP